MNRDLFSAAREIRADLDAVDWASTPLGAMDEWSPTLRNAVDLMLHSRFPMTLLWGPEFVLVYNDAYVQVIGDKHPSALGSTAREVFAEAWPQIGPMMIGVAASGVALELDDALVPLERHGLLEDCYFTFCYSAVRGPAGVVEGVIDVVTETTSAVKGRRRVELLARLSETLAEATSVDDVRRRGVAALTEFGDDFRAVDIRLAEQEPAEWSRSLPASPPETLSSQLPVVDGDAVDARTAWAVIEPGAVDRPASMLVAQLSPRVVVDDDLRDSAAITAAVIGRALGRVRADVAARAHRDLERQLSESLQRSLLSQPAQRDGLQVAVRYVPAASEAQVGGDWYDAFALPDGRLSLVVGHDREAAAAMAQVRNVLRGVSMTLQQDPARVLTALEKTLAGLTIDVIATSVVAHVEQDADASWTLRWSNAGHPAPVLVTPDGSVDLLERASDPMLGVGHFDRFDHAVDVAPGTSVVLYTDGLIERRGEHLDEGFAWLRDVLAGHQQLDAEAVCDLLIDRMLDGVEDDIALLVLKVG